MGSSYDSRFMLGPQKEDSTSHKIQKKSHQPNKTCIFKLEMLYNNGQF